MCINLTPFVYTVATTQMVILGLSAPQWCEIFSSEVLPHICEEQWYLLDDSTMIGRDTGCEWKRVFASEVLPLIRAVVESVSPPQLERLMKLTNEAKSWDIVSDASLGDDGAKGVTEPKRFEDKGVVTEGTEGTELGMIGLGALASLDGRVEGLEGVVTEVKTAITEVKRSNDQYFEWMRTEKRREILMAWRNSKGADHFFWWFGSAFQKWLNGEGVDAKKLLAGELRNKENRPVVRDPLFGGSPLLADYNSSTFKEKRTMFTEIVVRFTGVTPQFWLYDDEMNDISLYYALDEGAEQGFTIKVTFMASC